MSEEIKPRCYVPWQEMIIGADGNVVPCSYYQGFGNNFPSCGNVNENSILEIWNSKAYIELRNFLLSQEGQNGCPGCLAIRQGLKGYPNEPSEPIIEKAKPYGKCLAIENLQTMLKEIENGQIVLASKPGCISYTSSHECNFHCKMCYQDATRNLKLVNKERVDNEILSLIPFLIEIIAGGGEPFAQNMWKELINTFQREQNPVLTFSVTTNGSLLNNVVDKLSEFPRVSINISFDSTEKLLFESIRRGSNFNTVYNNMLKCLRKRGDISNPLWSVSASMTVMKSNFHQLPKMVQFMVDHKIPIGFSPLNVFPLHESIVCFNNPNDFLPIFRKAIEDTKRLYETLEELNRPPFNAFRSHLDVIENMIPFHLEKIKHYRIKGTVPFLYMYNYTKAYGDKIPIYVMFFPVENEVIQPCRYYSPIENGNFEVFIPKGKYYVGLTMSNSNDIPINDWVIVVEEDQVSNTSDVERLPVKLSTIQKTSIFTYAMRFIHNRIKFIKNRMMKH